MLVLEETPLVAMGGLMGAPLVAMGRLVGAPLGVAPLGSEVEVPLVELVEAPLVAMGTLEVAPLVAIEILEEAPLVAMGTSEEAPLVAMGRLLAVGEVDLPQFPSLATRLFWLVDELFSLSEAVVLWWVWPDLPFLFSIFTVKSELLP